MEELWPLEYLEAEFLELLPEEDEKGKSDKRTRKHLTFSAQKGNNIPCKYTARKVNPI
jgi:hypothetical protein